MFFLLLGRGLLQHVSVQWERLRLMLISKITKKIPWVMGILFINEISLVRMISLY